MRFARSPARGVPGSLKGALANFLRDSVPVPTSFRRVAAKWDVFPSSVFMAILSLWHRIFVLPMLDHAARNDRNTMAPCVVIGDAPPNIESRISLTYLTVRRTARGRRKIDCHEPTQ